MEAGPVVMIVGTQCPSETETEYNRWCNEKHIPEILRFKGLRKATRYELIDTEGERSAHYPKYLVIWEFESRQAAEAYEASPERAVAVEDFKESLGNKGIEIKWRAHYKPVRMFEK